MFEGLKTGADVADFFVQQLLRVVRNKNTRDDQLSPFRAHYIDSAQQGLGASVLEALRPKQLPAEIQHRIFGLSGRLKKRDAGLKSTVFLGDPGFVSGGGVQLLSGPGRFVNRFIGIIIPYRRFEQLLPWGGIAPIDLTNQQTHEKLWCPRQDLNLYDFTH